MSLGLPSHLARATNSRALATASHWAGIVCLSAALVNLIAAVISSGDSQYIVVAASILPMGFSLFILSRRRTVGMSIVFLVVGTICTFLYTATLLAETPGYHNTNLFTISLPVAAMTLVGGAGAGALAGILWSSVGFGLSQVAVFFGAIAAGRENVPNAISLGAYLFVVAVLLFDSLTRDVRRDPQSAIYRAIRDDQVIRIRHEIAIDSAAELHDNTISELVTIANSTPGALRPALRRRIVSDLHLLGRDRSSEDDGQAKHSTQMWLDSEMSRAIELVRDEGLSVEVSGDRESLVRLTDERGRALGLAVRQCLLNVLRHSGSAAADVAISSSSKEVSVLVVDGGKGFIRADTAVDRLGLRHSVSDRIERVGGSVTIWSSPDIGTTVMMVLPIDHATRVHDEDGFPQ